MEIGVILIMILGGTLLSFLFCAVDGLCIVLFDAVCSRCNAAPHLIRPTDVVPSTTDILELSSATVYSIV